MKHYLQKTLFSVSFDETIKKVSAELEKEGFGILTKIDIQATMKEKLNVNLGKYKILGACNPLFTKKALQANHHIGSILPCNVVVIEKDDGTINVSAVNPETTMWITGHAIGDKEMKYAARDLNQKLTRVLSSL